MATSPISGGSIDVATIVSALMEVEREPMNRLEQNASKINATISEFGKLQSALDSFRSAAQDMSSLTTWRATTGSSSDETSVRINAASGALKGSYAVSVQGLASHQTIVSNPGAARTDVIGGGTLTFELGAIDATNGFVADPERPIPPLTIAAGSTLEDVSAAINAAGLGIGASLVTDSQGTRLMLRSEESGKEQAFRVSASADGSSTSSLSIADLAYEPGATGGTMQRTQEAANALFELNGLPLESATNTPENVLENVSLTLLAKTDTPVELEISTNEEAIREKMDGFVTAYNELNSLIRTQTRYDQESQTAGPLQGNRMVLMVQSRMRDLLGSSQPLDPAATNEQSFSRLSDIGIEVGRDGSLSLDGDRFSVASADMKGLEDLFARSADDPAIEGFAQRFDDLVGNFLDIDGAITGATDSLRRRQDDISDQQDRMESRLAEIEKRLVRQYTTLDQNVSQMSSLLQSVSQLG